jgi:hypothetical protein
MNLTQWLDRGDLQRVSVTEKSLEDIIKLIERDLKDSQVQALSADRKFATAYGAALNLSSYVIRKQGYRVSGKVGHHKITFDVANEILGPKATTYFDFFDLCRRKRNKVDYDIADVVTETEVLELVEFVKKFKKFVFSSVK